MTAISGVSPVNAPQAPARVAGSDADGDNDGTKAAAAPATPKPIVTKPTQTMGNNVNTFA